MSAAGGDSGSVAVFTGAGASYAFGYPLTGEIFPRIWERAEKGELFKRDKKRCEFLRSTLLETLPGLEKVKDNLPLVTNVLSLIDQSILLARPPARRHEASRLLELRLLLGWALCDVIRDVKPTAAEEDALEDFVSWLQARAQPDRFAFISTNYDTSVEQRLFSDHYRAPRSVPTLSGSKRNYQSQAAQHSIAATFDFGFSWRAPYEDLIFQPPRPALRCYKLHGSLNWFSCDLCEYIYVNPDAPINTVAYEPESESNTCYCGHARLRPVIVTPSYVRDVRDGNLMQLWRAALEFLRRADHWYIVGYSLPPEDLAIHLLLLRAYNGRDKKPTIDVVTKNPDAQLENRFRAFFPDAQFSQGGVEGLVTG